MLLRPYVTDLPARKDLSFPTNSDQTVGVVWLASDGITPVAVASAELTFEFDLPATTFDPDTGEPLPDPAPVAVRRFDAEPDGFALGQVLVDRPQRAVGRRSPDGPGTGIWSPSPPTGSAASWCAASSPSNEGVDMTASSSMRSYVEEVEWVSVVDGFIPVPGPPGGGTRIQGELADPSDLPDDGNDVGDAWMIDGDLWVWTETDTWFNAGPYVGPQGEPGVQGEPGTCQGVQGVQGSKASKACRASPGVTGATGATGAARHPRATRGRRPGSSARSPPSAPSRRSASVDGRRLVHRHRRRQPVHVDRHRLARRRPDRRPPRPDRQHREHRQPPAARASKGVQGIQGVQGRSGRDRGHRREGRPRRAGRVAADRVLDVRHDHDRPTARRPGPHQRRITTLWLAETDTDGMNRAAGLGHRRGRRHDHRPGRQRHGDGPADHRHPGRLRHLLDDPGVGHHRHRDERGPHPDRHPVADPARPPDRRHRPARCSTKTSGTDYAAGWATRRPKTDVGLGNVDQHRRHRRHRSPPPRPPADALDGRPRPAGTPMFGDRRHRHDDVRRRARHNDRRRRHRRRHRRRQPSATSTPKPRSAAPLNAQTGTTYTPVVADENLMVTLSNAAAITVTLPQNSAAAFPVGAEVDFLWLGVGQPTFAAGTGATVNATPGLKLRARYSAATAKKIATNDVGRDRGSVAHERRDHGVRGRRRRPPAPTC